MHRELHSTILGIISGIMLQKVLRQVGALCLSLFVLSGSAQFLASEVSSAEENSVEFPSEIGTSPASSQENLVGKDSATEAVEESAPTTVDPPAIDTELKDSQAPVSLPSAAPAVAGKTWEEIVGKAADASEAVNIEVVQKIVLDTQSPKLLVKSGADVTLSGDATITGVKNPAFEVEPGGKLTLSGPSFINAQFIINGECIFNAGAIKNTTVHGPVIFVNGGTLTIDGTADFSGNDVSATEGVLSPDGVTEKNYAPITAYSGTVNLNSGTISGNRGFLKGGAIGVWGNEQKQAFLNIAGGEIVKNKVEHPQLNGFGGAIFAEYASVNVSSGDISGNVTEYGGGIFQRNGEFKMSDGSISENTNGTYKGRGGGIFLDTVKADISGGSLSKNSANGHGGGAFILQSTVDMSAGVIAHNKSVNWGGGIAFNDSNVTIRGGAVENNSAAESGGGLAFFSESNVTISALKVSGNSAEGFWGGGGIYNDNKSTLTMLNTAVFDNRIAEKTFLIGAGNHPVSKQGGGVWDCPTGSTVFNITNGVAMFDNTAPDAGKDKELAGAGDDFASMTTHFAGEKDKGHPVVLTERMLGGGERLWYQDGSVYGIHSNWDKDKQLSRYVAGGENTRIPFNTQINENKAFKSVPSADSKLLAKKVATVTVHDNVAGGYSNTGLGISGGGIANNGKLVFGTEDTWKLKINKSWESDDPNSRPTEIKVDVLVGGFKVDQVTLNQTNNWSAEITNFPDPATLIDAQTKEKLPITFKESGAPGYTLAVNEAADQENKVYTFNLTNKIVTDIPVKKMWDDADDEQKLRPESIVVELLENGTPTGKTLVLDAEKSWQDVFTDLPAYRQGVKIVYGVREISVEGYRSSISGNAADGFVITNKLIHKNPDGSVKTTVMADGVSASDNRAVHVSSDRAAVGVAVKDTISYKGLVAGEEYIVRGALFEVSGGHTVGEAKASATINLKASESGDGTWVIDFGEVKNLEPGKKYVVFERVLSVKNLVDTDDDDQPDAQQMAAHEDADDLSQTLVVDTPEKPVLSKTGTSGLITLLTSALLACFAGAGMWVAAHKRS